MENFKLVLETFKLVKKGGSGDVPLIKMVWESTPMVFPTAYFDKFGNLILSNKEYPDKREETRQRKKKEKILAFISL